jgi:hypothetical protein
MAAQQLEILALEPYYDGARRQMLQTVLRLSHHNWTLLKLPARRVERRLAASARWFAELLGRGGEADACNLLFASEMLNLPDLQRLIPRLARVPSIVYFHDNQTPGAEMETTSPLDTVNLNSAMAATEVWFNSQWHQDSFLAKTESLVARVPEIRGRNPVSELRTKSMVVPPPVDLGKVYAVAGASPQPKDPRTLFVDLRGGVDVALLATVLERLDVRGEPYNLITVGPQKGLPQKLARAQLSDREAAQYAGLHAAGIYLALRPAATSDELVAPALVAGCWPVVPDTGLYAELLPPAMHLMCFHDGTVESIVNRILDGWYAERPMGWEYEQLEILTQRDAITSVRLIDDLLSEVASGRTIGTRDPSY